MFTTMTIAVTDALSTKGWNVSSQAHNNITAFSVTTGEKIKVLCVEAPRNSPGYGQTFIDPGTDRDVLALFDGSKVTFSCPLRHIESLFS